MPPFGSQLKRRDDKDKRRAKEKPPAPAEDTILPPPPIPGDEFAMPTRKYMRPDNQLALTEAELGEEIPRMLTANNPVAPKNLARFNMKERCFKFDPMVDQTVVHYACDGWLLHKSSEEARRQAETEKAEAEAAAKFQAEVDRAAREKEAGLDVEPPDDSRQLRNQFNFGERAAQTFTFPLRDRATMTEPPPTASASGSCSAWEIFDEYIRDAERQRLEDASKPKASGKRLSVAPGGGGGAVSPPPGGARQAPGLGKGSTLQGPADRDAARRPKAGNGPAGGVAGEEDEALVAAAGPGVERALRILDRMVYQNSSADVAMDFKYWEDVSDAFRPGEGSLLPLWTFKCPKGKKHVTSIAWSPAYDDMFAVGYGSFHFHRQTGGLVAIHSLKNPATPECLFVMPSGVMSVHFHPSYANLIAVGCYDGSVAVFDARSKGGPPLYQASVESGKHSDAVWQVVWQEDELQKTLQFASVSADGDVIMWTLAKSELQPERLARLQLPGRARGAAGRAAGAPGAASASAAAAEQATAAAGGGRVGAAAGAERHLVGGLCMDFNGAPGQEHVYLVGTEDGNIVKCSKAYSSEYLATFPGHSMAAYSVRWNRLHPNVFLSASADWSLRVWDARRPAAGAVLSFDLGEAVGDAAWAPYSSTVLAAVTDDGRAHVFDLAASRLAPLCSQKVVRSARLTKLAFNKKHPVMLVGDSKGNVSCLKLSPNLRRSSAAAPPVAAPGGGGTPAAGVGAPPVPAAGAAAGVAGHGKFEAGEQQRLQAVLDVALKGRPGAAAAMA